MDDPGNLQGMQVLWRADAFDGRHGSTIGDILYPSCQAKSSFITIPTG
jgi:hypothetical protein